MCNVNSVDLYSLDCIVRFFLTLNMTIDIIKKLEYARIPPGLMHDPNSTSSMTTLEVLVNIYLVSEGLRNHFLADCVMAKLRYNLHHGHFDFDEFLNSLGHVYGLSPHDARHRELQSIFLSATIHHSLALSSGPKWTRFSDLLGENDNLRYEHILAKSWHVHVHRRR